MTRQYLFSQRTGWELQVNRLILCLEERKSSGKEIFDLTESNPTRCGFSIPSPEILRPLADKKNLSYAPSPRGSVSAREAVCRYYHSQGYKISPEQVFLTSSTSEAYSFILRLLADPGDEVLFPVPSYPLFQFLVELNDVVMKTYLLSYAQNDWCVDIKALAKTISRRSKALAVVNPNNPTGSFLQKKELEAMNHLCNEHGLALLCDEVFFDYSFGRNKGQPVSLAGNAAALTFVLNGISKCLGLPQMKLSWIIIQGPDAAVSEAGKRMEVIADTYLSANIPAQNALSGWLGLRSDIQREIGKRLESNRSIALEKTKDFSGCQVLNVQGGWYLILQLPEVLSEEQWALAFLQEEGVFLHPGYFFDFPQEAYAVVSLLPKESVFQEGLRRIFRCVGRHV